MTFFYSAEARPQQCNVSLIEHLAGKKSDDVIRTVRGTCNGSLTELHTLSTAKMTGGIHSYSCLPENEIEVGERAYVNITIRGNTDMLLELLYTVYFMFFLFLL